jgi:thioredoxin reductase (NADPH)
LADEEVCDITIIGGGPTGLFAAFYAGMRGMKTRIIDSLPELGGQLAALYPEKSIYDMPGFPCIQASDLAEQMVEQALRFNPLTNMSERVDTIRGGKDELYQVGTDKGTYLSKTLLICAGPGAFSPKRLDIPTLEEFEGRGVHYFVRNKNQFQGQRILIIGGGDSALDWAMNLEPIAGKIMLIHRRDVFRAHEDSVDWLLHRSSVETRLFWELRRLEGDDEHIRKAIIFDNRTKEEETIEIDSCMVNIGFAANIGPVRDWGLELQGNQIIVNSRMETNLPGVYAAGDICTYDGKLKLIATGVGEACIAVNYARVWIDPSARVFPGHSSNMDFAPEAPVAV